MSIINTHVRETNDYLDEDQKFSFVYIDVDLYRPTKQILDIVKDRVTKGSIICFDEGNNKDFPGEQKALEEFLKKSSANWLSASFIFYLPLFFQFHLQFFQV